MAGIHPGRFDDSRRAIGIANDLKGLVDSGHMPKMLETRAQQPPTIGGVAGVAAAYASLNEPPYGPKDVDYSAVILRGEIEKFARGRKLPLPWPNEPPEDAPIPLLGGGTTTLARLQQAGLRAMRGNRTDG
jgi:hypothetical protein